MGEHYHMLVVEDDTVDCMAFERYVRRQRLPYTYQMARSVAAARELLPTGSFDIVLMDFNLGDGTALDLLAEITDKPVVIITGSGNEDVAVRAMKSGAYDYMVKDPQGSYLTTLAVTVDKAVRRWRAEQELAHYQAELEQIVAQRTAALKETEARLQTVVEGLPIILIGLDGEGIIQFAVGKGLELLDLTSEDVVGRTLGSLFSDAQAIEQAVAQALMGQKANADLQVGDLWFQLRLSPRYDAGGQCSGMSGVLSNITDRVSVERARSEERNLLRTVIDNLPDYIYVKDTAGNWLDTNTAADRMLGLDAEEAAISESVRKLRASFDDMDQRVIQSSTPVLNYPEQLSGADGLTRWMLNSRVPLLNADNDVAGVVGIGRDVTALYEALNRERDQRVWLEALHDTTAALTSTLDQDAVMNRILENVGRVVLHDAANIMLLDGHIARMAYSRGYPSDNQNLVVQVADIPSFWQMMATGEPVLIQDTHREEDWQSYSQTNWIRSTIGSPLRLRGHVVGFLNVDSAQPGFFTEVHAERLQAFAHEAAIALENAQLYRELEAYSQQLEHLVDERTGALRASEARYRAIVEDQMELVVRYAADGTLTFVNDAICRFTGLSREALLGQKVSSLMPEAEREAHGSHFAALSAHQAVGEIECVMIDGEGREAWFQWIDRAIVDEAGAVVEYQGVGRDTTEARRIQQQLRQALEHEMALGEMRSRFLSMAAHDLRNPLAVIYSSIQILLQYGDRLSPEKQQERLQSARHNVQIMEELLDDILTIGRVEASRLEFEPQPVDIPYLCEEVVTNLTAATGEGARIQLAVSPECGAALLDIKLVRHMLNNLLSNALKYSADNAPVDFEVACTHDDIVFRIRDRGIGIPQEEQSHVFQPFTRFSNVAEIPGTGLGLAIVQRAVDMHGGRISFESQEQVGTTFEVHLPFIDPRVS